MDKLKVLLLAGVVALVVASVVTYFRPANETVREVIKKELGSVVGPDITSPFLKVNDFGLWPVVSSLNTGSTTVCSLRAPAGATSSLVYADVRFVRASSTATYFQFGKSLLPDATTTSFGALDIPAASSTVLAIYPTGEATTTAAYISLGDRYILSPNTYVNLKYGGNCVDGGACNTFTGTCRALFIQ